MYETKLPVPEATKISTKRILKGGALSKKLFQGMVRMILSFATVNPTQKIKRLILNLGGKNISVQAFPFLGSASPRIPTDKGVGDVSSHHVKIRKLPPGYRGNLPDGYISRKMISRPPPPYICLSRVEENASAPRDEDHTTRTEPRDEDHTTRSTPRDEDHTTRSTPRDEDHTTRLAPLDEENNSSQIIRGRFITTANHRHRKND
jgi:hypothetical protein